MISIKNEVSIDSFEKRYKMNYSLKENVRLLVSLLKAYDIKHIVLSPGNRNIPFAHMVEQDDFFTCYSIIDERSAGFFAVGLIERLHKQVAICCTSGTAVCNYTSAVAEAYYQNLPLVVLTADRPAHYLNQREDQMLPQSDMLKCVTKLSVHLPGIVNKQDYWYCKNRIHAALLALDHHGKGPVHINFEIDDKATNVSDALYEKPDVMPKMNRYELGPSKQKSWTNPVKELKTSRVMIVYGQCNTISPEEIMYLNKFTEKFNCIVAKDHMANLHCDNTINLYTALTVLSDTDIDNLLPDIIISMNGNSVIVQPLKAKLDKHVGTTKQWLVAEDGIVRDSLRNLHEVFECSSYDFLAYCVQHDGSGNNDYAERWKNEMKNIKLPQPKYSSLYAVKRLLENLPRNSVFHIANSSSIRYANMFPLDETIRVYCNRGTNGIDGSFSSFVGNAAVSEELCFLLIGDLSFFYDMNACWNRYCGKNIRILLNNNEGAELFYYSYGNKISTIDKHIAASHNASAKGWVESRGFTYLCAHNKEEFEKQFALFINQDSDKPILFEVITSKDEDVKIVHDYYESNMELNLKHETKKIVKKLMRKSKPLDIAINKVRRKF